MMSGDAPAGVALVVVFVFGYGALIVLCHIVGV